MPAQNLAVKQEISEQEEPSIVDILRGMEKKRIEQIEDFFPNESKNDYLSSAAQLSYMLESLTDSSLRKKIQRLIKFRDSKPELLFYDHSEDDFWSLTEKEFTKNLDELLIGLTGDDFNGLNHKHHLWNAIKYLGTEEWEVKDKLIVYDTILPFCNPDSEEVKQNLLSDLEMKNVVAQEGILRVKNPKDLDEILAIASRTRYTELEVTMSLNKKGRAEIDREYGKIAMIYDVPNNSNSDKGAKVARFWRKAIKYTTPLSNWFISGLTDTMVIKLNKYFEKYGEDDLTYGDTDGGYRLYANWGAGFGAITGMSIIASSGVLVEMNEEYANTLYLEEIFFGGLYLLASSIQQAVVNGFRHRSWMYNPHGNYALHGLLAQIPFSLYNNWPDFGIRKKDFLVKFSLERPKPDMTGKPMTLHNYQDHLENLASLTLSEKLEENLNWSRQNFHTQGEYFATKLLKSNNEEGFGNSKYLAREHNALIFYDGTSYSPYKKISALVCFKDERYAITYITRSDKAEDFDSISRLLSQNTIPQNKLEELEKLTSPSYLHFTYFKQGKKMFDEVKNG